MWLTQDLCSNGLHWWYVKARVEEGRDGFDDREKVNMLLAFTHVASLKAPCSPSEPLLFAASLI